MLMQYLFKKNFLRTYCTPGTFPGVRDALTNKTETTGPHEDYLLLQKDGGIWREKINN